MILINGDKEKKKRKKLDVSGIFQEDLSPTLTPTDTIQQPQKTSKLDVSGIFEGDPVSSDQFLSEEQRPQDAIQPLQEESRGIFTQLKEAFTGENLIDPLTKDLPEIGELETDNKLKVLGAMLSATVPQEQANILESNIEGLTQRKDTKGNIIVKFPNGNEAFINKAGASVTDFRNLAAEAVQFFPASKLAGLGKTFLQKIGLGAAGAGLVQTAKEGVQSQIGGEFDISKIAEEAALGVIGEGIPAGFKAIQKSRQAKQLGSEVDAIAETAGSIKQAEEATKATGVEFFPAQKTLTPSALEETSFIATLAPAQKESVAKLKNQNKQIGEAVENFLKSIAKSDVVQTGAERFRIAAEKAIEIKRRFRAETASPIYKQAFRRQRKGQLGLIDTKGLETKLSKIADQFDPKGQIAQNMKKALAKLENAKGNLQKLHLAKIEIDQTINAFGLDAVGNTTKRFLTDIKKDLTNELTKQSPSYRAAKSEFERLSPPITEIEGSILGKIAKIDDTQLKSVARKIFDPEQLNVAEVVKIKKIINSVDPEAFDQLLRVELERRLGSIKPDAISGAGLTVENLPDQLNRAIFGNQKQAAILKNSVSPEQLKNLNYLQTALKRASTARLGGSQTATRTEITERLRRGFMSFISNTFTPLEGAKKGLIASTFDKNVKNMSKALFDTKWQPQLSKIRKINPNTPEAARLWTQLLNDIENENEVK